MSSRGRRGRGRPPRTPSLSSRAQNIRKPRSMAGGDSDSRSSTPVSSCSGTPNTRTSTRLSAKFGGRDVVHKPKPIINRVVYDDNSDEEDLETRSMTSLSGSEKSFDEDVDDVDLGPDLPSGGESDFSEESYSTVGSTSKRKYFWPRRPKTPEYIDDAELPSMELPPSATDLLIEGDDLLRAIGIYEVLRHFRLNLRVSPFRFEDFCAALICEDQSSLLSEIHIMLLKALLREEDANNSTFSPQDMKDSVNVGFFFLDGMTWYECVRQYLDSDKSVDFRAALPALEKTDYTKVILPERLQILQSLTDLFLSSNSVREVIMNEGNIHYDDHCRACYRLGDLLCCEMCSAVYHLGCVEPPLENVPEDDWLCNVCRTQRVEGVTDCVSEAEKSGMMCRQEPLGFDRYRRKYYFVIRRLIVEAEVKVDDENHAGELWYYSTPKQLQQVIESLDSTHWERELVATLKDLKDDIVRQMKLTLTLTEENRANKISAINQDDIKIDKLREDLKKAKEEEEERKRKKKKVPTATLR